LAIVPQTKIVRIVERPRPALTSGDNVELRVLQVGVCATYREEIAGGRACAPNGQEELVIGHEMIGQVIAVSSNVARVRPGDYAVLTVRRGCGKCRPCAMNRPDMCASGRYRERGIWGLDGYQTDCVVDADLRASQQHRLFGLPDSPGLSDVLTGRASLEEALVTVEEHHITVLPVGSPSAHPAELLGTTTMRRVLESLRSRFDRIIIDAPAATPLADVGVLAPLVDSVILVVRAGVTSKPAIHDAIGAIDAGKLLGIVLNEAA